MAVSFFLELSSCSAQKFMTGYIIIHIATHVYVSNIAGETNAKISNAW